MRRITYHHNAANPIMERLLVVATNDEPVDVPVESVKPNCYKYEFFQASKEFMLHFPDPTYANIMAAMNENPGSVEPVGFIFLQQGPFDNPESSIGTLGEAVLAALIDHYQHMLQGPLSNRFTALTVTKLEEADHWLRARTQDRIARNVLGTMNS